MFSTLIVDQGQELSEKPFNDLLGNLQLCLP